MIDRIDPKEIEFTYSSNFNEHFNESVYGIQLYRHFDSLEKAHEFGKQLKDQLEQDAEKAKKYDDSSIVKLINSICKSLNCGELQIVDKFLELKRNEEKAKKWDNLMTHTKWESAFGCKYHFDLKESNRRNQFLQSENQELKQNEKIIKRLVETIERNKNELFSLRELVNPILEKIRDG